MIFLVLFLYCTAWSAWRVASWLGSLEPEPLTTGERLIWAGVLGVALWLAQGWLLALAGRFQAGALLACSAVVLAAVLTATRLANVRASCAEAEECTTARRRVTPVTLLPFVLAGVWIAYSAAALLVTPVSNHDALSYHFPKAARLALSGSFALYPSQDLRVTYYPGNYEMLAATFMTFLRSDTSTGLITSAALLLFLATSFALFRRMWKDTTPAALGLAILLGSPVLLLHLTAHKNDILVAGVTLNALMWLGRFAIRGGTGSALVGVVCVALAAGIKFHGLFLVPASAVLIWHAWRGRVWRPSPRAAVLQVAGVAVLFVLLGGAQYVANVAQTWHLGGIEQVPTANGVNTVAYPAYWQVPRFVWMFLAAPLLTDGQFFRMPWSAEEWFWPAYELYFSHYGLHVSVLLLLLPLGVRWARRELDPAVRRELTAVSMAALLLVAMNAFIGIRPYGGFAFIPRFLFFGLPILLAWTWCPWVVHFTRLRPGSWVPLAASLAIPLAYGGVTVAKDAFTPFSYVQQLWLHPELRREIHVIPWRAASAFDRIAPSDATVAVDAGYDGWTYPLYGAALSRRVEVIVNAPEGYVPAREVDWIVVDHAFPIIWGHPDFTSMALASRYLGAGTPSARELRVFRSISRNPDFTLVYFRPNLMQAVFHRVRPAQP